MTQAAKVRGYVQRKAAMTKEQVGALEKALRGEDPNAIAVVPVSSIRAGVKLEIATNGLAGAEFNDEGKAI